MKQRKVAQATKEFRVPSKKYPKLLIISKRSAKLILARGVEISLTMTLTIGGEGDNKERESSNWTKVSWRSRTCGIKTTL